MRYLANEVDVMKRMMLELFGYDVQQVYVNEDVFLGVAEYYEGNNAIEIMVLKEKSFTPLTTMFKSFETTTFYFRVLEFEGRRYRIIIKTTKL